MKSIIKMCRKIAFTLMKIYIKTLAFLTVVNTRKIMFISFHGRSYSDNPRAIYEELINDPSFEEFEFVWVLNNNVSHEIDNNRTIKVSYKSMRYFYHLVTCKYWVINCRMPEYLSIKKSQIYLQTWHGTPLKRLAHDIQVSENTTFFRSGLSFLEMTRAYDADVEKYNCMISPSSFTTEVFQSAFRISKDKLIETGYPRNDILSNASEEDVRTIKERFHIPLDKKVLLYAPTWRDNSYVAAGYEFQLLVDFHRWKEELGNEYVVIFKPHYLISNTFDLADLEDFVYSIPTTVDISELYLISDALITDYSSVFFDYAILNRPIYFYTYDLEQYKDELRGFYLDIYTDLPGCIYVEEVDMLLDIKNNVYDYDKTHEFNQRFNNMEDGKAAKRVIDIVFAKDV